MKNKMFFAVVVLTIATQMYAMDPRCRTVSAVGKPPKRPAAVIRSCPSGKVERIPGYTAGASARSGGRQGTIHYKKS